VNDHFEDAYDRLRALARRLTFEDSSQSATDLVHEVYLRLQQCEDGDIENLYAFAGRILRNIVIDRARAQKAQKRGAGWQRVTLTGVPDAGANLDLLDLCCALDRLEPTSPRLVGIAQMRLFLGLEISEIAGACGVSESTVKRDWRTARAWLRTELG
jgi:RNA polymerase sigma factor (TIGR02999 family)